MTTVEILRAARAKIEDEANWAKEYYAYTAEGLMCDTTDPDACKFCAMGAVFSVLRGDDSTAEVLLELEHALPEEVRKAAEAGDRSPIPYFNDEVAEHADILATFDRAIALAEKS